MCYFKVKIGKIFIESWGVLICVIFNFEFIEIFVVYNDGFFFVWMVYVVFLKGEFCFFLYSFVFRFIIISFIFRIFFIEILN